MRQCIKSVAAVTFGLLMVVLGGCLGKSTTKPTKFYHLRAINPPEGSELSATEAKSISVGVGPVTFPEYLKRSHIVTRTGENRLVLAEYERWAAPLRVVFTRTLTENLALLLSTERVAIFPWRESKEIDYQVEVEVIGFDGELGGNAVLLARWTILGDENKAELLTRKSIHRKPVGGGGYESLVSAQSGAVAAFSREIAQALQEISRQH